MAPTPASTKFLPGDIVSMDKDELTATVLVLSEMDPTGGQRCLVLFSNIPGRAIGDVKNIELLGSAKSATRWRHRRTIRR